MWAGFMCVSEQMDFEEVFRETQKTTGLERYEGAGPDWPGRRLPRAPRKAPHKTIYYIKIGYIRVILLIYTRF